MASVPFLVLLSGPSWIWQGIKSSRKHQYQHQHHPSWVDFCFSLRLSQQHIRLGSSSSAADTITDAATPVALPYVHAPLTSLSSTSSPSPSPSLLSSPPHPSPHPHPHPHPPILSTSLLPHCRSQRCPRDRTLPVPPPYIIRVSPFNTHIQQVINEMINLPSILIPWDIIKRDIQCPLIVDQCNLLFALSHRIPQMKVKKRLRSTATFYYHRQKNEIRPYILQRYYSHLHHIIRRIITQYSYSLTQLPGYPPSPSSSSSSSSSSSTSHSSSPTSTSSSNFSHAKPRYPPITRHHLKTITIIEQYKERIKENKEKEKKEEKEHLHQHLHNDHQSETDNQQQMKKNKLNDHNHTHTHTHTHLMNPGYVPPDRWHLPGHVKRLMRLRAKAKQQQQNNTDHSSMAIETSPPII